LESETSNPDFWQDLENSQKVLQKIKRLKDKIERFQKLCSQWEDLKVLTELSIEEGNHEMAEELEKELLDLERK